MTVKETKYITVPVLFVVCKISWLWEFYFSIRTFYISIWPNRIQTFIPYYAYRNVANLNLTLDMARTGCTKTYVRLSRTGRNLVQTCKPLAWLVCGRSSFLIRKNTGTVENWLQIKVEFKFMLLAIKARFKSRTIYKANNAIKCPICFWLSSFEHDFWDSQVLLGFGQQNLIYCLSERQVDKKMFLFRFTFQIISSLLQTMGTGLCLIWVCLTWFDCEKKMSQYQCCLQNFSTQSKTSDWILILTVQICLVTSRC